MEQLLEYRQRLLNRYEDAARQFCEAVETATSPDRPREADAWDVHQIAAHTRDTEKLVYGLRVRRTLEEDDPLFENFDGQAWMDEHYRADEPLASILDELADSVRTNIARLRSLPPEAWTRPSRHETYGGEFTIQTWVERGLAHIEEHLKTVTG
jgi:DinB superfamily